MRISLAAGVVAAGLLAAAGAASAQDSGPYIGAGVGLSYLNDAPFSGTGISGKADFDQGWGGLLALGYRFDSNWRAELEGGYRRNEVGTMSGGPNNGNASAFSAMVNALYDIRTGSAFTPYLGVGGGWVRYKASGVTPSGTTDINDSDGNWGVQGIAGISYDVSPRSQLFLDYHYLRSQNPDVHTVSGTSVDTKYRDHLVTVGFRYMFGAPAPAAAPAPAPVATPAPTPAPAPQQVVRSFQVFFDFDRADIRPDARPIIEEAGNNARRGNVSRINLTGHADRAGSAAYNQRLSVRRAEAVKAEFVRMGFSPNDIAVVGKGETDPLVPTPDGVREPKNRRVEIVF